MECRAGLAKSYADTFIGNRGYTGVIGNGKVRYTKEVAISADEPIEDMRIPLQVIKWEHELYTIQQVRKSCRVSITTYAAYDSKIKKSFFYLFRGRKSGF